ncbi:hypothetical protein GW17_00025676 [Ensete ventricosum]|nr:hypothetical protein GW17_00025676 [Ensete ventricosum]
MNAGRGLTAELDLLVEVVDVDSHVGRSVTAATAPSIVAHPSPLLPLMPIEIRGKSNRQAVNRTRHWSSAHMIWMEKMKEVKRHPL